MSMKEHEDDDDVYDPLDSHLYDDDMEEEDCGGDDWDEHDQFLTDAEADADVLKSAGMGTDEDYGLYDDPYADYYD